MKNHKGLLPLSSPGLKDRSKKGIIPSYLLTEAANCLPFIAHRLFSTVLFPISFQGARIDFRSSRFPGSDTRGFLCSYFRSLSSAIFPKFPILGHLSLLFFLLLNTSFAHPSWGIAVDTEGNIIFADVLHHDGTIWKYTPDGKLTAWFKDDHSHFIQLDKAGNLWGVDYRYISATDEWESTLWKVNREGKKNIIISPTRVFEEFFGNSFLVDEAGVVYFETGGIVYQRKGSKVRAINEKKFGRLMSMYWGPDYSLFIADNNENEGSVMRMDTFGNVSLVGEKIITQNPKNPPFSEKHLHIMLGLFVADNANVYATEIAGRRVVKVNENGEPEDFYVSQSPWFPVGITQHGDKFYIMETGFISGKGHLGPRIVEWKDGRRKVLVNVAKYNKNKGTIMNGEKGNHYTWRLLFFALVIFGGILLWIIRTGNIGQGI